MVIVLERVKRGGTMVIVPERVKRGAGPSAVRQLADPRG
jgi:hypothetical protein